MPQVKLNLRQDTGIIITTRTAHIESKKKRKIKPHQILNASHFQKSSASLPR
jgi:hypothetical protein